MNTQRVATDISINYQGPTPVAPPVAPGGVDPTKPSADKGSASYNAAFTDLQATLEALGHPKLDVEALGAQPTLEGYYPELLSGSAQAAPMAKGALESTSRVLFWYHPDYLGNVDLVTERDGKTYEFFTYNPWGEEMHQYNANTFGFSSPYRFNAKEKDAETGLHYYGARYYQSKLSVWLSVDPLAHETLEPYVFTGNNPVMFIDPDGREVKWPWRKREKCPNDFGPDKKPRSTRLNIKLPKIKWQTVKHTYVDIGDSTTKRIATRRRLTRGEDIDNLQIDVRSKSNSTYTLRIVTGTKVPDDVRVNANGQDIVNTFPSPNPLITDDSGIDFSVPAGMTLDFTSSKDPDSDKSFSQTRYDLYETTTSEEMTRTTKYRFLGIIPLPYKTKVSTYNTQRAIEKQKDPRMYRYRGRWSWI